MEELSQSQLAGIQLAQGQDSGPGIKAFPASHFCYRQPVVTSTLAAGASSAIVLSASSLNLPQSRGVL